MGLGPSKESLAAPSKEPEVRRPSSCDQNAFTGSHASEGTRSSSKTNRIERSSEADFKGVRRLHSGEHSTGGHVSHSSQRSSSALPPLQVVPLKNVEEGPTTLPSDENKDRDLNLEVKAALLAFILLLCFGMTLFLTQLTPPSVGSPSAANEVNLTTMMVVPEAPLASHEEDAMPAASVVTAAPVQNRGT